MAGKKQEPIQMANKIARYLIEWGLHTHDKEEIKSFFELIQYKIKNEKSKIKNRI